MLGRAGRAWRRLWGLTETTYILWGMWLYIARTFLKGSFCRLVLLSLSLLSDILPGLLSLLEQNHRLYRHHLLCSCRETQSLYNTIQCVNFLSTSRLRYLKPAPRLAVRNYKMIIESIGWGSEPICSGEGKQILIDKDTVYSCQEGWRSERNFGKKIDAIKLVHLMTW